MKNPNEDAAQPQTTRLQVVLARCGLDSRRACEEYISTGRVAVDGHVVTELGTRVRPGQKITVDGEILRPERPVYYLVNKPKGVLCTNTDPQRRPRIIDLFPPNAGRLFPVGRLDENTTGLILVTNDGEISHQLAHPRFQVPKIYKVQVAGNPSWETLQKLKKGLFFSDGKFKVDDVHKLKSHGLSTYLEVVLKEGQNREVRRLFARMGHKVLRLERVEFGPLRLKGLPVGAYRALTGEEIRRLHEYLKKGPTDRAERKTSRTRRPDRPVANQPAPASDERIVEVSPLGRRRTRDLIGKRHGRDQVRPTAELIPSGRRQSSDVRTKRHGKGKGRRPGFHK